MIGDKVAEKRKQLGWSRIELARRLGVDPTRIYELEHGLRTDCNVSTARRMARVLGCSLDYLAETWDMSVDPEPLPEPPPRRPRGRPRKRPLAEASR